VEQTIQHIIPESNVPEGQTKILVVDDEESVRHTLTELLQIRNFRVTATESAEQALKLLEQNAFDVVLSDLLMPRVDGIALAKTIKEMGLNVPVVVMTGYASIETAVESMKAGASDFITKPFNLDQITIVINRTLENKKLQQLAQEREYFEHLSNTDGLTELYNHRYFQNILNIEVERERRYKRPLSLLMIDIDNFKSCNDTHGHLMGDVVLQQVGALVKKSTRGCDYVARYGGEEFAVILPETTKQEALVVAERIRASIAGHVFTTSMGKSIGNVTVTIGLSSFPDDAQDRVELIDKADKSLYQGKTSGKNRICAA
jgi:diguanylate cyclase (GGDEF)-like protein